MTREQIAAMFDRRRAAFDRQDAAALAADYTADCTVESPSGGTHHGPAAAEHVFKALDVTLRRESVIIDGGSVAEVVSIEGKDVGNFLGLPPTGKSFQVPGVFLYELKDGRIAYERRIYDFTAMLIQTGLLKAKPA